MFIYQLIDVLISVLDHYNTLTTNNHHSSDENYMSNHSSPQVNTYISNTYLKKLHSVIHTNIKHHHGNTHEIKKKHSINNIKCNIKP